MSKVDPPLTKLSGAAHAMLSLCIVAFRRDLMNKNKDETTTTTFMIKERSHGSKAEIKKDVYIRIVYCVCFPTC